MRLKQAKSQFKKRKKNPDFYAEGAPLEFQDRGRKRGGLLSRLKGKKSR